MARKKEKARWIHGYEIQQYAEGCFEMRQAIKSVIDRMESSEPLHPEQQKMMARTRRSALDFFAPTEAEAE